MQVTITRVNAIEGMTMKIVVASSEARCTYDIQRDEMTVEVTKNAEAAEVQAHQDAIIAIATALRYRQADPEAEQRIKAKADRLVAAVEELLPSLKSGWPRGSERLVNAIAEYKEER